MGRPGNGLTVTGYGLRATGHRLGLDRAVVAGRALVQGERVGVDRGPQVDPLGRVHFELNDHLGNVTTTITDELIAVDDGGDDDMDYFQPNIVTAQGYEPFGGLLPKRVYARTAVDTEPAPTPPGTLVLTESPVRRS